MRKYYITISLILFSFSLLLCGYIFLHYNRTLTYWGNEWIGEIWLPIENINVTAVWETKKEKVALGEVRLEEERYVLTVYKDNLKKYILVNPKNTIIYSVDKEGNIVPSDIKTLLSKVGKEIELSYYRKINGEDWYLDTAFI